MTFSARRVNGRGARDRETRVTTAESVTEKGVSFGLPFRPQKSAAIGRVMFFQHEFTGRVGILNAMAVEQEIPLQAFFPMGASSVTYVLFGSINVPAKLEAFDKNGKSLDVAVN